MMHDRDDRDRRQWDRTGGDDDRAGGDVDRAGGDVLLDHGPATEDVVTGVDALLTRTDGGVLTGTVSAPIDCLFGVRSIVPAAPVTTVATGVVPLPGPHRGRDD